MPVEPGELKIAALGSGTIRQSAAGRNRKDSDSPCSSHVLSHRKRFAAQLQPAWVERLRHQRVFAHEEQGTVHIGRRELACLDALPRLLRGFGVKRTGVYTCHLGCSLAQIDKVLTVR